MTHTLEQTPFLHSMKYAGRKIHLGLSGSIACYKAADLLRAFLKLQMRISATLTRGAHEFVTPLMFKALGADPVYAEMFSSVADTFAHLEPGSEADAFLIAPASANAIASIASGAANDMLSTQILAFSGPLVIAPAMNPRMWQNKILQANINKLKKYGCVIVEPGEGSTACGENGKGKLAELPAIFLYLLKAISIQDMQGLNVMVTLGPTREPWDGARFWSNPSSGKMGVALATCAWLRGATVTAICGPNVSLYLPDDIKRVNVITARQMYEEAAKIWPEINIGCFCAAVADFAPVRPENAEARKIRKKDVETNFSINFTINPDIMKSLAEDRRNNQKILGFAAEIAPDMQALLPLAHTKLQAKHADLLAANRINPQDGAFGSENSVMAVIDKNGTEEIWSPLSKADIAWDLFSWLLRL